MKVLREVLMHVDTMAVGDRIKIRILGEKHTATAIQMEKDGVLFLLDDCLKEKRPMNEDGGTDGGYDSSDMRDLLRDAERTVPEKTRKRMVAFNNGDLFRLLSLKEMFGLDKDWKEVGGQIPWLKDRKHRIVVDKAGDLCWYWLSTPVSASDFAFVSNNGNATGHNASNSVGIRPAFKISRS